MHAHITWLLRALWSFMVVGVTGLYVYVLNALHELYLVLGLVQRFDFLVSVVMVSLLYILLVSDAMPCSPTGRRVAASIAIKTLVFAACVSLAAVPSMHALLGIAVMYALNTTLYLGIYKLWASNQAVRSAVSSICSHYS